MLQDKRESGPKELWPLLVSCGWKNQLRPFSDASRLTRGGINGSTPATQERCSKVELQRDNKLIRARRMKLMGRGFKVDRLGGWMRDVQKVEICNLQDDSLDQEAG